MLYTRNDVVSLFVLGGIFCACGIFFLFLLVNILLDTSNLGRIYSFTVPLPVSGNYELFEKNLVRPEAFSIEVDIKEWLRVAEFSQATAIIYPAENSSGVFMEYYLPGPSANNIWYHSEINLSVPLFGFEVKSIAVETLGGKDSESECLVQITNKSNKTFVWGLTAFTLVFFGIGIFFLVFGFRGYRSRG